MSDDDIASKYVYPPPVPVIEPIIQDGLFSVAAVSIEGGKKTVFFRVGEEVTGSGFVPEKISVKIENGQGKVVTVQGTNKKGRKMYIIRHGKSFEFDSVSISKPTIKPMMVRPRRQDEPVDSELELKRFEKFIEMNKELLIDADVDVYVDDLLSPEGLERIAGGLSTEKKVLSPDNPKEVLRALAKRVKKKVSKKATTREIATIIARGFVDIKLETYRKKIREDGRTIEYVTGYIVRTHNDYENADDQRARKLKVSDDWQVGDFLRIKKGLDKDSTIDDKLVGDVAGLGGKILRVISVVERGEYIVEDVNGTSWTVTDGMIEGLVRPENVPEEDRPRPKVPTTYEDLGKITTPRFSMFTEDEKSAFSSTLSVVEASGVKVSDILSMSFLEKGTGNAYYIVVVYEKARRFYSGSLFGNYGSRPNLRAITNYTTFAAASKAADSKVSMKLRDGFKMISEYTRPLGVSGAGQSSYYRLLVWGKTFVVKKGLKEKFMDYRKTHGGNVFTGSVTLQGQTRPEYTWQLIGPDRKALEEIGRWASEQSTSMKPISYTVSPVHSSREFKRAPTFVQESSFVKSGNERAYAAIVLGAVTSVIGLFAIREMLK